MKKFTKLMAAVIIVAAVLFTIDAKGQTTAAPTTSSPWKLSLGLETGIPTGNATDISNFEIGGTARLQYNTSATFAVMLTSGYHNMIGKSIAGSSSAKY